MQRGEEIEQHRAQIALDEQYAAADGGKADGRQAFRKARAARESEAARMRISAGLMNSEGWMVSLSGMMVIQLRAPFCTLPNTQGEASAHRQSAMPGRIHFFQWRTERIKTMPTAMATMPARA